jgi:hypothetical protein
VGTLQSGTCTERLKHEGAQITLLIKKLLQFVIQKFTLYIFGSPYNLPLGNLNKMKHNHLGSNLSQRLITQKTNFYFSWVVPSGMSNLKNITTRNLGEASLKKHHRSIIMHFFRNLETCHLIRHILLKTHVIEYLDSSSSIKNLCVNIDCRKFLCLMLCYFLCWH